MVQTWKHQLKEELSQQKEATCFKALPNTIICQESFAPKKEKKKSVDVQEPFQLAVEKRAKARQQLEKNITKGEAQRVQQVQEAGQPRKSNRGSSGQAPERTGGAQANLTCK